MSPASARTMLAVVLHGKEDVRLERLPVAEPGEGEVRVRVGAALTCGTDLKIFRRGYHARMIVPPAVFGHEMAGTIDAVGPGVDDWAPGERVVVVNSAPCGDCFFCAAGREELCDDLLFFNGAFAECAVVPARIVRKNMLRIPETLDFEAAALVEPLACAVHAVTDTGVRAGETLVVLGAGPLGLLLVRCAALVGARVLVIGRREERLRVALRMGAAETLDQSGGVAPAAWVRERTGGRGADRVIEAVGRPEVWEQAVSLARKGGTINCFGGCPLGTGITVPTERLHYEALALLGTFHHTPRTVREALRLLVEGMVPADLLIQDRAPLDRLPELLPVLARGGGPLKLAVHPVPEAR